MKNRLVVLLVCLIGFLGLAHFERSQAQSSNQVGLVVSYGDGRVLSSCVPISESGATGLDVLQNSGLNLIVDYSPLGAAVCTIGDVGCPAENCFCKSPPDNWNYWRLQGDSWVYSNFGASNVTVNSGAVEGWAWGNGSSAQPPMMSFDQICAPPVVPTKTEIPATATFVPTNTPSPTQTPPPVVAALPTETSTPTITSTVPQAVAAQNILSKSPSATPLVTFTRHATPAEIAAIQEESDDPESPPTQLVETIPAAITQDRETNPATTDVPSQNSWLAESGYPIFAFTLIGLGVFLLILVRRQLR